MNDNEIMFKDLKDILSVKDLCNIFGISLSTAYNLVHTNTIRSIKIGNSYKIPKIYLLEYIKNN